MVLCLLIPRFALLAALGDRRALLSEAVALAPEGSNDRTIGEVSASAEAFGVIAGMAMGEALARCPDLRLVSADPEAVRNLWDEVLDRVEGLGGEPESERAGAAVFQVDGLRGIHGGGREGVITATRRAMGTGVRLGVAPCRFAAHCAALQARPRRGPVVVEERGAGAFLSALPVSLLRLRPELNALPETLERLGIRTLGELAALSSRAVAERFGHPGLLALDLARGHDTALEPRRPPEPVSERLELPDAVSGGQLERTLELLIARVLARRERRGRTLRSLAISARLVVGGSWRTVVVLRSASANPERIGLALTSKLSELPAPASSLALEVEAFGPPAHDQGRLLDSGGVARRERLGEAVRQARQAAGDDAALRVLDVDPDSRIPERRSVLAPLEP